MQKSSSLHPYFYLPATIRTQGEALLHQQCWYWGRDVQHASENLLLAYGFTRHRQPEGSTPSGCSAYQLQIDTRRIIVLWGFGLFFGDAAQGGMFLRRYGFIPKFLSEHQLSLPIWSSEQLPPKRTPRTAEEILRTLTLLLQSVNWIVAYEEWVVREYGLAYRQETLRDWKQEAIAPQDFLQHWRELQQECHTILNQQREKFA